MFTVYANTPGYLSEDEDPFTTDSLDEARTALVDMLARDEDDEISGAYADVAHAMRHDDTPCLCVETYGPAGTYTDECPTHGKAGIEARYAAARTEAHTLMPGGSVYVPAPEWQTHGLGRVYSIAAE